MALQSRIIRNGMKYPGKDKFIERHWDLSAANAIVQLTVPTGNMRRLLFATVDYSAVVTGDHISSITLNSGAGAGWDNVLGVLNVIGGTKSQNFLPTADIIISDDDDLLFACPAGGAAITGQIAIYTEIL